MNARRHSTHKQTFPRCERLHSLARPTHHFQHVPVPWKYFFDHHYEGDIVTFVRPATKKKKRADEGGVDNSFAPEA
jgi:hypothetical protein